MAAVAPPSFANAYAEALPSERSLLAHSGRCPILVRMAQTGQRDWPKPGRVLRLFGFGNSHAGAREAPQGADLVDDGRETPPEVKAFVARMIRPP